MHWIILTGEYPPQTGGVSDYTALLAHSLAEVGDTVEVYAPPSRDPSPPDGAVTVRRLPDHFGLGSLRVLKAAIVKLPARSCVLVQYVPQAFGWKGMNLPFCFWLWCNRRRFRITIMFHEVATPWGNGLSLQDIKRHVLAGMTRLMAFFAARSAKHIFVSIPGWIAMLESLTSRQCIEWLPVPSTIPTEVTGPRVAKLREKLLARAGGPQFLIGHFGTFGGHIAKGLRHIIPRLLSGQPAVSVILIGRGGQDFLDTLRRDNADVSHRVHATGSMESHDVSEHLAACDLLIQPYIDGISSRRTSAMAGLAIGVPIVTTRGFLTESIWPQSHAVELAESYEEVVMKVTHLLADEPKRRRLGAAAAGLYREKFDITHTVSRLSQALGAAEAT